MLIKKNSFKEIEYCTIVLLVASHKVSTLAHNLSKL